MREKRDSYEKFNHSLQGLLFFLFLSLRSLKHFPFRISVYFSIFVCTVKKKRRRWRGENKKKVFFSFLSFCTKCTYIRRILYSNGERRAMREQWVNRLRVHRLIPRFEMNWTSVQRHTRKYLNSRCTSNVGWNSLLHRTLKFSSYSRRVALKSIEFIDVVGEVEILPNLSRTAAPSYFQTSSMQSRRYKIQKISCATRKEEKALSS